MPILHLVYPHGERISSPDSVGRHLRDSLGSRYQVRAWDWKNRSAIVPEAGDILVGHPHPDPRTTFRASARHPGWGRRILLAPLNLDLAQVAFLDSFIDDLDLFLAITGPYWYERIASSPIAHWLPKIRRMDMAVDPVDFPRVKGSYSKAGNRRFVYIGHSAKMKNTPYLGEIAARVPGLSFARIGPKGPRIAGVEDLGPVDFAQESARELIAGFDFVISPSRFDANPTTLLEAMAWGLVPVCTPQSGYEGVDGIVNIPLDDPNGAAAVIQRLQAKPDAELRELQRRNWERLPQYGWERFAAAVVDAVESDASPPLGPRRPGPAVRLAIATATSRYNSPAVFLTRQLGRWVRARLRAVRGAGT